MEREKYIDVNKMDTLGAGVIVERAARCRTKDGTVSVSFKIDYSGMLIKDILEQSAAPSDVIKLQRANEKLSSTEYVEAVSGKTFHASTIGHKVLSDKELIEKLGPARLIAELRKQGYKIEEKQVEEKLEDEKEEVEENLENEKDEEYPS